MAFLSSMALAMARAVAFDVRAIGVLLVEMMLKYIGFHHRAATDLPWELPVRILARMSDADTLFGGKRRQVRRLGSDRDVQT